MRTDLVGETKTGILIFNFKNRMGFHMKIWIQFSGLGRKMGRLELGLGLEVLRVRVVPPARKNTKG